MKHLYVIGNGFDIFNGLHTRYEDFRKWLQCHYVFIYEILSDVYDIDGEWWNDFEMQLGNLDVKRFVKKFPIPRKSEAEILEGIAKQKELVTTYNFSPSLVSDSRYGNRLRGLLDLLQYCFEQWVDSCQRVIINYKKTYIEQNDSYFINFNYTDVLQGVYNIPEERVLHIHGRASKHDRLIFGHNKCFDAEIYGNLDCYTICQELKNYEKNPYENIYKYAELPELLKSVEFVHIYGFSFSPIDLDYIDWIIMRTSSTCKWEISWYTEIDKKRINAFINNYPNINSRVTLMQLQQCN